MVAITPTAAEAASPPRRTFRLLEGWDRYASDRIAVVGLVVVAVPVMAAVASTGIAVTVAVSIDFGVRAAKGK